ncbi:MAG: M48 family metallopeptidase [Bacteriovoracia bacterium]
MLLVDTLLYFRRFGFFLIFFAANLSASQLTSVEVVGSTNIDAKFQIKTVTRGTNKHFRIFPEEKKQEADKTHLLFNFDPVDSNTIFLNVKFWGLEKNIQSERYKTLTHFEGNLSKPDHKYIKGKPQPYINVPFASVNFKISLSPSKATITQEQFNIIDAFSRVRNALPHEVILNCEPKSQVSLVEGKLLVDFTKIESLVDCLEDTESFTNSMLDSSRIGKANPVTSYAAESAVDGQRIGVGLVNEVKDLFGGTLFPVDHPATQYARKLMTKITSNSDLRTIRPVVFVVDSEVLNAFAIVGGYVFVSRKLIEKSKSEAELAGVLGHEWAHVVANHVQRQRLPGTIVQAGSLAVISGINAAAALGKLEFINTFPKLLAWNLGLNIGLNLIPPMVVTHFSRLHEAEADLLGVQYATRAGFAPWGLTGMFEIFQKMYQDYGVAEDPYLSTHPLTHDRIASTTAYSSLFFPASENYVESSQEYLDVKEMLKDMPRPSETESQEVQTRIEDLLKERNLR